LKILRGVIPKFSSPRFRYATGETKEWDGQFDYTTGEMSLFWKNSEGKRIHYQLDDEVGGMHYSLCTSLSP